MFDPSIGKLYDAARHEPTAEWVAWQHANTRTYEHVTGTMRITLSLLTEDAILSTPAITTDLDGATAMLILAHNVTAWRMID